MKNCEFVNCGIIPRMVHFIYTLRQKFRDFFLPSLKGNLNFLLSRFNHPRHAKIYVCDTRKCELKEML